jgi:hypothetical protein
MNRRLRFVVLFVIGAAGFSACAAVSAGFLYPDETGFLKADGSRSVYSLQSEFDKERDLKVYLYKTGGGISKIPNRDVTTTIEGLPLNDHDTFNNAGVWTIGVNYANTEPAEYMITVLSPEEQGGSVAGGIGGGDMEIIIIGP